MKPFPALFLGWLATGFGAFAGSVLGNAGGPLGLKLGAVAGGFLGVVAAVLIGRKLGWLPRAGSGAAIIGGLLGFAIAVPITLANMDTPVIAVVSCALAGAGILVGAGTGRGQRG
jgi:hypothetical protein